MNGIVSPATKNERNCHSMVLKRTQMDGLVLQLDAHGCRHNFRCFPLVKLRFLKITCNPLGTSAFGPSKTRRKIDIFFEKRQKRLVKLTSIFKNTHFYNENEHRFLTLFKKSHKKQWFCASGYQKHQFLQ